MGLPSSVLNLLGNTSLETFDVLIIGSGAGGSAAAYVLTAAGLNVLILEAGDNNFPGLDDPDARECRPALRQRRAQGLDAPVGPPGSDRRTAHLAADRDQRPRSRTPDVNVLNRTVGGTTVHADMKYPRFNEVDFRIASALRDAGRTFDGTSFIDWPLTYDELEPFYTEAEIITGVSGVAEGPARIRSPRTARGPYPMPPHPGDVRRPAALRGGARRRLPSDPLSGGDQLAAVSADGGAAAAAVRELRLLQRLRLPEQFQELGRRDDAARGAADRQLPAALQLLRAPAAHRRHRTAHRRRRVRRSGRRRCGRRRADRYILAASAMESVRLGVALRARASSAGPAVPPRPAHAVSLSRPTASASSASACTASAARRSPTACPTSAASPRAAPGWRRIDRSAASSSSARRPSRSAPASRPAGARHRRQLRQPRSASRTCSSRAPSTPTSRS